jgi:hypothetical protein
VARFAPHSLGRFSGESIPSSLTVYLGRAVSSSGRITRVSPSIARTTLENTLRAAGPIQDYTGQPYTQQTVIWSDKPADRAQLETRTRTALESGEYPLLDLWYAHLLDPVNYPDPTTTENEDHRCDLSRPAYKNAGGSASPTPHTPNLPDPLPASGRPSGAAGAPDPYLRWGTTSWGGTNIDNWAGWGWRHIQAKHGWSAADEAATRTTLQAPVFTEEQTATSMRYYGPEYQQNGAICRRRVVVEYGVQTGDPDGTPKGIITSFAEVVRNAN